MKLLKFNISPWSL